MNDGQREKAIVLAMHERKHSALLHELRLALQTSGPVTVDDANKLLDEWGIPPHPTDELRLVGKETHDRRFLGQLFRAKGWRNLATVESGRKQNHARPIEMWEYAYYAS
jgi:hypothetical protein